MGPIFLMKECRIWHADLRGHRLQGGGGILQRNYFAGEIFMGGHISPPLGIPKLQLPHAHPAM